MDEELLPCPFCGEIPSFPSGRGVLYELECDCGHAGSFIQISDLMSSDERKEEELTKETNYSYSKKYIDRARGAAIKGWNTRIPPEKTT